MVEDKNLFHFDEDVYIGGVYIWCEDSLAYQVTDVDWFDTVQQVISDFEYIGALYIVGDLNIEYSSFPELNKNFICC